MVILIFIVNMYQILTFMLLPYQIGTKIMFYLLKDDAWNVISQKLTFCLYKNSIVDSVLEMWYFVYVNQTVMVQFNS